MTNWEEQYLQRLRTGVGSIGVTEGNIAVNKLIGQLLVSLLWIITGIIGGGIWDTMLKYVAIILFICG